MLQALGSDSSGGTDGKPGSMLAFSGPRQVHAIYNWLLDSAMAQAAEAQDVPLLLAPVPFLGASRQRLIPQVPPVLLAKFLKTWNAVCSAFISFTSTSSRSWIC